MDLSDYTVTFSFCFNGTYYGSGQIRLYLSSPSRMYKCWDILSRLLWVIHINDMAERPCVTALTVLIYAT